MRRATVVVVLLGLLAVVSAGVQQQTCHEVAFGLSTSKCLSFHNASFFYALVYRRRELVQQYIALVAACIICWV